MTILEVSSTLNYGSTGRIVERLGLMARERGVRCVVAHGPRLTNPSALEHYCVGSRADEDSIARHLYTILREFDDESVTRIYSECFTTDGFGQAIMNRLLKAAGHKVVYLDKKNS